jgi:hypothetical protein
MAPRPMLMIAATGDWTKNTPTVEYPAIKSVYELFDAADKVQYAQFDAPHNYHKESREAVYGWFAHWFKGRKETTPIKEQGVGSLTLNDLLVFYGRPRPANELSEQQLTASLIQMRRKQFEEAWPRDAAGLERFKEQYGTALKYALMAEYPKPETISAATVPPSVTAAGARTESLVISRTGKPERLFINIFHSTLKKAGADQSFVLVVNGWTNEGERIHPLAIGLARSGHTVFQLHAFQGVGSGEAKGSLKFITGYNRTDAANRVQDVLTALAYLRQRNNSARLSVLGDLDSIGTVVHARSLSPQIDRMVVDASHFDNTSDDEFLKRLPVPDLLRAGDFATAVAIAPKTPLLIHNTGNHFQTDKIAEAYRRFGKAEDLQIKSEQLTDAQIIEWLKRH